MKLQNGIEIPDEKLPIIAEMAATGIVAVFEIRGQKPETVEYVSKKDGKAGSFSRVAVAAELLGTGEQVLVHFGMPRGQKGEIPTLPFKRGESAVAVLTGLVSQRGMMTAQVTHMMSLAAGNDQLYTYQLDPRDSTGAIIVPLPGPTAGKGLTLPAVPAAAPATAPGAAPVARVK